MNRGRDAGAWASYWDAGGGGGGCLPSATSGIDDVLRSVWAEFVKPLRRGARVLDLATGDGAVLVRMRAVRPDLKLTGIDSAPRLPPAPKGIVLKAGVAMERLPFADSSFDAVSSQFGVEYGDIGAIAAEAARVLAPRARLGMIVHDREGPIVAHNTARAEALRWALDSWMPKARAFTGARAVVALATPREFAEAHVEARRRFPGQPVAAELTTGIFQALELGRRAAPAQVLAMLDSLSSRAGDEIARIDQLCAVAHDGQSITRLCGLFEEAGFELDRPQRLREIAKTSPFAWLIGGRKRS